MTKSVSGWDSSETYPGAALSDAAQYKMWFLGRDTGYVYSIGYAISDDGLNWAKHAGNPVMTIGNDGDNLGPASVIQRNGIYHMWYTIHNVYPNPPSIGYAFSIDGIDWIKYSSNPVLKGTPSAWDRGGVSSPAVIYDGMYKMWYAGDATIGGAQRIGYATSPDGIVWTKYSGNPVIDRGSLGSWDDSRVFPGTVVAWNGIYELWYTGVNRTEPVSRIGRATSADGISWVKDQSNPIIDVGPAGMWDEKSVVRPMVLLQGGQHMMWYGGFGNSSNTAIGLATKAIPPTYKIYLPALLKAGK